MQDNYSPDDKEIFLPLEDYYTLCLIATAKKTTPRELIKSWILATLDTCKTTLSDED